MWNRAAEKSIRQVSKQAFNTDFTEKRIKPRIYTENIKFVRERTQDVAHVTQHFSVLLTWQILACCGDFQNSRGGRSGWRQSKQDSTQMDADEREWDCGRHGGVARHERPCDVHRERL